MATDLGELVPILDMETGFEIGDSLCMKLLQNAVLSYNDIRGQVIECAGSTLDVTLGNTEKRVLVLLALGSYLRGELVKAAKNAIIVSDLAGRVQLNYVAQELRLALKDVVAEILARLSDLPGAGSTAGIASEIEIHEIGETLELTGQPVGWVSGQWPWPWWR